jgi:ssDNA-binding Zn-finger/Zn-ribbon topoisomerase 1
VGAECQYCGADLDAAEPRTEVGWLYGVECSRCPPGRRRSLILARPEPAASIACPDCGAAIAPAASHPDVLVVKEMTYEVCPGCGARCGVAGVVKHRDVSNGTM